MDTIFTIEVHHGGYFDCNPPRYVNGLVNHVDDCDSDRWSKFEAEDIVQRLGYRRHKLLWYKVPNLSMDESLRLIHSDQDVVEMSQLGRAHEQIEMYVEHVIKDVEDNGLAPLPPPLPDIPMTKNETNETAKMFNVNIDEDNGKGVPYYNCDSEDSEIHADYPLSDGSDYDDVMFDALNKKRKDHIGKEADDLFGDDNGKENEEENREHAEGEEHSDHMKFDYESEELLSGEDSSDSDEEGGQRRLHTRKWTCFKPVDRPTNIRFEKGMLFSSLQQFKLAITEYAVHGGYAIKFVKNDKQRVRTVCEKPCPWVILCAKLDGQLTYQLKTVELEHKCTRTSKNPRLSSKFLATKLVNKVRDQPNIRLSKIQEKVHALWDYCHELRRSNPGTTVKLQVKGYSEGEEHDKQLNPTFQRMYICFDACKKGFQYCRPVIGVDGCHLKGPHGGILLSAVGRDPNEEYFPIAFAVVEDENKDRLDTTLKELQPGYEHRLCCRHLYNNLRKKHPGLLIREKFWFAAYASYTENFNTIINELRTIDSEATKWVEGFNSTILEAREKAIISMAEDIRLYLMGRFQKNRKLIQQVDGVLCPVIKKRLKKEHDSSQNWSTSWSGELIFEVKYGFTKFTVDLNMRECSCRRWELSGIPCAHAISCICFNKEDIEGYVLDWFKVETYRKCYAPLIYPTNDPNMWSPTGYPAIVPPQQRRPAGRPKKLRRKEPDEPKKGSKLRRSGFTVVCQRCKRTRHNKRTCKRVVGGNREIDRANASQSTPCAG
ncbi:hypothetical protein Vadar_023663 [Vaccinium darrowii]|uniref:Uncharacterized protein n=1 Tax=Vaccinium darrowii TaxID=229202 RepID=A0ACB7Z792_9ERIC|nr:hypothetical protein Vadar_023663 [Vaccinium darrowii]